MLNVGNLLHMPKRLTTQDFISRARTLHGDRYDYSKTVYVSSDTRVTIVCPKHGEYEQFPHNHLKGCGCNACGVIRTTRQLSSNSSAFTTKARERHSDRYDYARVEYTNNHTDVIIICNQHGKFLQTPQSHLQGSGCPICGRVTQADSRRRTTEEFVRQAKGVHGDVYDYRYTEYTGRTANVTVICQKHGRFEQEARNHLKGHGCAMCASQVRGKALVKDASKFVEQAKRVHGNKYDYSKVRYFKAKTHILITCPKHGDFQQTPDSHLCGAGCIACSYEERAEAKRNTTAQFIEKARQRHDTRYDYSKVDYVGQDVPIVIICPKEEHGEFIQLPKTHLRGAGCPECVSKLFYHSKDEITLSYELRHFLGGCPIYC